MMSLMLVHVLRTHFTTMILILSCKCVPDIPSCLMDSARGHPRAIKRSEWVYLDFALWALEVLLFEIWIMENSKYLLINILISN